MKNFNGGVKEDDIRTSSFETARPRKLIHVCKSKFANISNIQRQRRRQSCKQKKERISRSMFYLNLFLSTTFFFFSPASPTCCASITPYNGRHPPSCCFPPPLLNEEACVCCIRLSCVCVRAAEEHVGASNSTVESGRVRVAFCGGVK